MNLLLQIKNRVEFWKMKLKNKGVHGKITTDNKKIEFKFFLYLQYTLNIIFNLKFYKLQIYKIFNVKIAYYTCTLCTKRK